MLQIGGARRSSSEQTKATDHRLRIWALRVDLDAATRIDFSAAKRFDLNEADDLIADEHAACQALAERMRADPRGPESIIVPSAALPGTENLVIFGERTQIPYSWEPISSIDIPACVIAERSQPPSAIASLVRYVGEPHPALEAWREGRSYRFPDLHRP
jgi:RES domain